MTTFDFYDLLIRGDKSRDARLLPGDVIFIPPAGPQVALTGSVRRRAIYELNRSESGSSQSSDTIQQLIDAAGGFSTIASGSRVSIERIDDHRDRETVEVSLDAAGLATLLRDGDVVNVLSIVPKFQQTVTLRGNLANPGRFAWHEGMKLSDLIPDRPSLITRNYWWRRAQLGLSGPEFQPLDGRGPLFQPTIPGYLPGRQTPPATSVPGASLRPLSQPYTQEMVPGWQLQPLDNGQSPGAPPDRQQRSTSLARAGGVQRQHTGRPTERGHHPERRRRRGQR